MLPKVLHAMTLLLASVVNVGASDLATRQGGGTMEDGHQRSWPFFRVARVLRIHQRPCLWLCAILRIWTTRKPHEPHLGVLDRKGRFHGWSVRFLGQVSELCACSRGSWNECRIHPSCILCAGSKAGGFEKSGHCRLSVLGVTWLTEDFGDCSTRRQQGKDFNIHCEARILEESSGWSALLPHLRPVRC